MRAGGLGRLRLRVLGLRLGHVPGPRRDPRPALCRLCPACAPWCGVHGAGARDGAWALGGVRRARRRRASVRQASSEVRLRAPPARAPAGPRAPAAQPAAGAGLARPSPLAPASGLRALRSHSGVRRAASPSARPRSGAPRPASALPSPVRGAGPPRPASGRPRAGTALARSRAAARESRFSTVDSP